MNEDDREGFVDALRGVCDLYGQDLTEFLIKAWWAVLKPYDLRSIKQALAQHLGNPERGQFMPKPADVVRLLGGTAADNAQLAWTKVAQAVARVGGHESVVFDDERIHAVLADMGGWVKLCDTLREDNAPFMQREFEQRYRAAHTRGISEWPRMLSGRIALENGARYAAHTPPPVVIGNSAAAQLVYQRGHSEGASTRIAIGALLDHAIAHQQARIEHGAT